MEHKIKTGEYGAVHYWEGGEGEQCILFTHGATMDNPAAFNRILDSFLHQQSVHTDA